MSDRQWNPTARSLNQEPTDNLGSPAPDDAMVRRLATDVHRQLHLSEDLTIAFLEEMLRNAILFNKKQQDYGSGNISAFGDQGILVRTSDKLERLKNMYRKGYNAVPANETVEDSWRDLSVYAAMAIMCRHGTWK